jgi:hypothetical protein
MSIPTRPGGQVAWCANKVNNSPTGGPNREAYDSRYGTDGWAYAEHPPYQVFNEWNYNVYQNLEWLANSVTQLDSDVSALGGGKYVDATLSVIGGSASIPFATHGISDPVVQLQDVAGAVASADIIVDGSDNITIQNTTDGTYKLIVK